MISFRSHVVSLIAVFLALAVGVVLGGGPLSEVGRGATAQELSAAQDEASQARASADRATAFGDAFALETAGRTIGGTLAGQSVVVLTMPGAAPEQTSAINGLVKTAGGTVVGSYALQRPLFAYDQASLVDSLGSQLAGLVKDTTAARLTSYARIGRLLGDAVATTTAAGQAPDANGESALEGLTGAGLVTAVGDPARKGALVLVVLGDEPATDAGVDGLMAGLCGGLKTTARGVVVAGSDTSALLAALRDQGLPAGVSTVDSIGSAAGQVGAVMALAASSSGTGGSFGASGSDGAVALR